MCKAFGGAPLKNQLLWQRHFRTQILLLYATAEIWLQHVATVVA